MMSERSALNTVLSGLFDYAGTFPPASLPLEQAVAEALRFDTDLNRPFLVNSRGVFNSSDVRDVNHIVETEGSLNKPFEFSTLLTAGEGLNQSVDELHKVLADSKSLKMGAIEIKVSSPSDFEQAKGLLKHFSDIRMFLEPSKEIRDQAVAYIDTLGVEKNRLGIKVRAAGPTAVSTSELAVLIKYLADKEISLKVTQGLHSPFIKGEAPTGFLSLAVASYFSRAGASVDQIENILSLTDLKQIDFNHGGRNSISYDGLTVELKRCLELSQLGIIRVGSCSIKEPDEYLDKLGL